MNDESTKLNQLVAQAVSDNIGPLRLERQRRGAGGPVAMRTADDNRQSWPLLSLAKQTTIEFAK